MFDSNKFQLTRNGTPGTNTNLLNFSDQFEVTQMYEDPEELSNYNRNILRDRTFNPNSGFEHEAPRLNTGAKWALNLREGGVYGATDLPYVHDDYDVSFRDHDTRGWNLEHDWKKFRADTTPRASLTLWGKDDDLSIPGEGIAPVDMVSRLVELRRSLKERINWFSESLGNIAAGKNPNSYNRPTGDTALEDKSQAIDPSIFDSVSTQNLNRYLSNNLHLGGKYFTDRTTTDHVAPIATYGYLFRSAGPETIEIRNNNVMLEQIKSLDLKSTGKNFIKFLESYDCKKNSVLEGNRFARLFERETKNTESYSYGKDILALLGITQNEIRWLNSKENANRQGTKECIANIVDMIQGLEKLPPNVLLNIRADLLREHAPEFKGGLSNSCFKTNIKRVLESRNSKTLPQSETNKSVWSSIETAKKKIPKGESKNITRGVGNIVNSLFGINLDQVETYSKIDTQKSTPIYNLQRLDTESDKFETDSMTQSTIMSKITNVKNSLVNLDVDNEFGRELTFNHELKSWNDSHLIPKQLKK